MENHVYSLIHFIKLNINYLEFNNHGDKENS